MKLTMNTTFLEDFILPGWHNTLPTLDFKILPDHEARWPPEERGLRRDQVRLMVTHRHNTVITHTRFDQLPTYLKAGDVLVINTSKTIKAAINVHRNDGLKLELHLSTRLADTQWIVELREVTKDDNLPYHQANAGEKMILPGGGEAVLVSSYPGGQGRKRLRIANLKLPMDIDSYLEKYGFPIRYKYVHSSWPIEYYQNVYATEPGSAEMPSAGRAFTPELITRLVAQGIQLAPLHLHTGVASLEEDEKPYDEYYRVPRATADLINCVRSQNGRVIAVGTTVVRAIQTVTGIDGSIKAGEGWTKMVITPATSLTSVDGLLTGLHEPRSSHLSILLALADEENLRQAYQQALQNGYLWHEFGDLHLILP